MRSDADALTENETSLVWTKLYEAEVRSQYFGELSVRYVKRKQIMDGLVLFLSSGAAATFVTPLSKWVPVAMSVIVAAITAYSISTNLDKRISALSKLHCAWNSLNSDYERLWNHWHEAGAEQTFEQLLRRGRDASENALEMPYDEATMQKWENVAYSRLQTTSAV